MTCHDTWIDAVCASDTFFPLLPSFPSFFLFFQPLSHANHRGIQSEIRHLTLTQRRRWMVWINKQKLQEYYIYSIRKIPLQKVVKNEQKTERDNDGVRKRERSRKRVQKEVFLPFLYLLIRSYLWHHKTRSLKRSKKHVPIHSFFAKHHPRQERIFPRIHSVWYKD